jgi:hypothetical protein
MGAADRLDLMHHPTGLFYKLFSLQWPLSNHELNRYSQWSQSILKVSEIKAANTFTVHASIKQNFHLHQSTNEFSSIVKPF